MTVADALPDRPLTLTEIAALADADGIDGAEPVAHDAATGRVVCVALAVGDRLITVGWHPERSKWEVIACRSARVV